MTWRPPHTPERPFCDSAVQYITRFENDDKAISTEGSTHIILTWGGINLGTHAH